MGSKGHRLLVKFNGNPPVEEGAIEEFRAASKFHLPEEYLSFLRQTNGGEGSVGEGGAYAIFWKLEELNELNDAYQVEEFAPGLFLFGSNGGGEAFAFDGRNEPGRIVKVPFVGMELDSVRLIAPNFDEFLEELSRPVRSQ